MMNNTIKMCFILIAMMAFSSCSLIGSLDRPKIDPTPTPTPEPDNSRTAVFTAKKEEYTTLPKKVQLTTTPYIKGKLVNYIQWNEVERDKRVPPFWTFVDTSAFNTTLPLAKTPEEVGTITLEKCDQHSDGFFTSGDNKIPAYGWKCELTIIDKTISAVIYRKTFESRKLQNTESVRNNRGKVEAEKPSIEMSQFLDKLPQKP
jgi:hypothetical protein